MPRSSSPIPRATPTLLTVQMVRLDELRAMLTERRLGVCVADVETGEALTEAVDELAAVTTDAKIAADVRVEAWRLSLPVFEQVAGGAVEGVTDRRERLAGGAIRRGVFAGCAVDGVRADALHEFDEPVGGHRLPGEDAIEGPDDMRLGGAFRHGGKLPHPAS